MRPPIKGKGKDAKAMKKMATTADKKMIKIGDVFQRLGEQISLWKREMKRRRKGES